MKTQKPDLALQKHLEAMSSSLALHGWSSTQKTCKNSIYNIHIYKYIYIYIYIYIMFTHSDTHTVRKKNNKSTGDRNFIELMLSSTLLPVRLR